MSTKDTEEACILLNEWDHHLFGPKKFTDKDEQPPESEEDDDAEAALKNEVGDIKACMKMRLRRSSKWRLE